MKLLRFGERGQERPGILDANDDLRDLSGVVADIDGTALTAEGLALIATVDRDALPRVSGAPRIGACVAKPGKIVCVGLNYADHAKETGAPIPPEPVIFTKAISSLCGPFDDVIKPAGAQKLDWEVELAIVIGSECSYLDKAQGEDAIAGYAVCNDISERQFQLERSGQWDLGKGCDTFCPLGPWLVTKDEIDNVLALDMWLSVNGEQMQNGSTSTMIFKPDFIVSYLSHFMTLQPGDIILTGTPPGVGLGQKPPWYLNAGDKMELGISQLGAQTQTVVECAFSSHL